MNKHYITKLEKLISEKMKDKTRKKTKGKGFMAKEKTETESFKPMTKMSGVEAVADYVAAIRKKRMELKNERTT